MCSCAHCSSEACCEAESLTDDARDEFTRWIGEITEIFTDGGHLCFIVASDAKNRTSTYASNCDAMNDLKGFMTWLADSLPEPDGDDDPSTTQH